MLMGQLREKDAYLDQLATELRERGEHLEQGAASLSCRPCDGGEGHRHACPHSRKGPFV